MSRWKRLTDVGNSGIEIDLDAIAYMQVNGSGTQITFNTGRTLTVRESPEDVAATPKKLGRIAADATQASPRQL